MEDLGIGRPSTYASTLKTLQIRKYMKVEKRRIFPEIRGRMVATFLAHYFPDFVDYGFTAKMERLLDEVSTGKADWKEILKGFWVGFHEKVSATMKVSSEQVI
ncbi:hypothetical protein O6H91_Y499600 [Diphasiastrum complanatum]|nr:hypothetical protein O6H91_Y499600 [Diphasiastrum complanatum]